MHATLPAVILILTIAAWVSAAVLMNAARGAHIGALTERAVAAVMIAAFGTFYSLTIYNNEVLGVVSREDINALRRLAVVVLLAVPVYWLVLYLTRCLGERK